MKMRIPAAVVAATAFSLILTGCFGGTATSEQSAPPQESSGPVELRFMIGQPEDAADLEADQGGHREVRVPEPRHHRSSWTWSPSENVRTILQTQLRSGKGPDVFGYDTGPGFAGALAKAGLVHDLTGAYEKYDWPIYDFAKQRVTFDGKLVGIPNQLETVGLFYNKDLFAKHGVSEPQNLNDLMAGAAKLRDAGVIPIAVNDKDGWQGGHLLSMSLSSEVGGAGLDKLLSGEIPWDDPSVVKALQVWADLYEQKLLPPSPTAINYDNGNALFYSGKAAINPTGSWLALDTERNAKFEVGYIPFPSSTGTGIFSGGLGAGIFINATTTKVDAAEKFLDYGTTQEHGKWAVENLQDIPAYPVDTTDIEGSAAVQPDPGRYRQDRRGHR